MRFVVFVISYLIILPDIGAMPVSSKISGLDQIIQLVLKENQSIQAARQAVTAAGMMKESKGYFPDPMLAFNAFGSPVETRNGPQTANIMISQGIPWPSALHAEEQLAASKETLKQEQHKLLELDLRYKTKSLVYKFAELSQKLANKEKMQESIGHLNQVVMSRLRLGSASQSDVARINIEIAGLSQTIRQIRSQINVIRSGLIALTSGHSIDQLLPDSIAPEWTGALPSDLKEKNISDHPLIRMNRAKVNSADASLAQAHTRRLPRISASVSWIKIDQPESAMAGSSPGKDAWAIGASLSIPISGEKYNSLERGFLAERSEAELNLKQVENDFRNAIATTLDEYQSVKDVTIIYEKTILPQAYLALKSDQESYTQGGASFDTMIEDVLRVIRYEDLLIESKIRQATLRAAMEKLTGKTL